jgi:putative transposase
MARLTRLCPVNIPQHIIQRGNNRQICFANEQDFEAYISWLKVYAKKYEVEVHAWVLMTNHVHLLCTPKKINAISQMMQSLGRCYVRYFNNAYQRTGTLWEGRFKACLVEEEAYLLQLYRYIELNPVRAGMVVNPADYYWSSYQINALGKVSTLCTPHSLYLALGSKKIDRHLNYQGLFDSPLTEGQLELIRRTVNKGIVLGNERFYSEVAVLTGRRLATGKCGRPVGWRKKIKVN